MFRLLPLAVVAGLTLPCPPLAAQTSLASRVHETRSGTIRFSFAAREGVCGFGGAGWGAITTTGTRREREHEAACDRGPVRVALDRADGRTSAVRLYVAGRWRADAAGADLGTVGVHEATDLLLRLAEQSGTAGGDATSDKVADAALQAVSLADSVVVWPRLLAIAKDVRRPSRVRSRATFWLSQAAGERITGHLATLVDEGPDDDVRKQAVFALSQRPADEGVPALIAVARNRKASAPVRKQAYFWLGQTQDPRAIAFLEETLTRP